MGEYRDRKVPPHFGQIASDAPESTKNFFDCHEEAFEEGGLGAREKALIALAHGMHMRRPAGKPSL